MLQSFIYILYAIIVLLALLLIYDIACLILLKSYVKTLIDNESIDFSLVNNSKFSFNIWKLIENSILKRMSKKKIPVGDAAHTVKKITRAITKWAIGIALTLALNIFLFVALAVAIKTMDIAFNNVAGSLQALFGKNENCVCYAKCTGDVADDEKCSYEMLFGSKEYQKLINHMYLYLTPDEQVEFETQCPNGKTQGEFIINHMTDAMVSDYKEIVKDNANFREDDGKNRSTMTNAELEEDLKHLLADYKEHGRNPNCDCKHGNENTLQRRCMGEEHWKPGWTWRELWDQEGPTGPGGTIAPAPSGTKLGHATGQYAITLADGLSYYWYHQSGCTCVHNVNHSEYGRYSNIILGGAKVGGNVDTATIRGCSTYSTAIAISNIVGMEVTPYNVLEDLLGGSVLNGSYGYYYIHDGSNGIRVTTAEMMMDKKRIAERAKEIYGQYGLDAKKIDLNQKSVDEILSKGGVIVFSVDAKSGAWEWYTSANSSHFITLRKKEGDLYYCLNSTAPSSLSGSSPDERCMNLMNTGVTWDTLSKHFHNQDGVAYWNIGGGAEEESGGNIEGLGPHDAMEFFDKCGGGTGNVVTTLGNGVSLYDGLPWGGNAYKLNVGKVNTYIQTFLNQGVSHTMAVDNKCKYAGTNVDGINATSAAGYPILSFCHINEAGVPENWAASTRPRKFCVILKDSGGKTVYMPCTCQSGSGFDAKGHTWPGGLCQTFLSTGESKMNDWYFNSDGGHIHGEIIEKHLNNTSIIKDKYGQVTYGTGKVFPQINLELNESVKNELSGYTVVGFIAYK